MLPTTAPGTLQSRRSTSVGNKLSESVDQFDSTMKSMFAKATGSGSMAPEAVAARRNLLLVILGAIVVLGLFTFPSIFGTNAAADSVSNARACLLLRF